jgi:hypothetical protein
MCQRIGGNDRPSDLTFLITCLLSSSGGGELPYPNTEPAAAAAAAGVELLYPVSRSQNGQLRATNEWAITWLQLIDASRLARWNNLDRDCHCVDATLVTNQVYLPTAYVGEALACCVDCGRTGAARGLVRL